MLVLHDLTGDGFGMLVQIIFIRIVPAIGRCTQGSKHAPLEGDTQVIDITS